MSRRRKTRVLISDKAPAAASLNTRRPKGAKKDKIHPWRKPWRKE